MASSRSTRRGSQYLSAEQELSIGECKEHNRSNEAYCEECRVVICPSCLMFGSHQGHKVLPPGQAARFIREKIDKTNKAGKLGPDYAERFLIDIREARIKMQKAQSNVMNQIQESFWQLIKALKARRTELEDLISAHFNNELKIVQDNENSWAEKQNLAKKILEISNMNSDENLLINSALILAGLDALDEKIRFQNLKLLTSVDFSIEFDENKVGFLELLEVLEKIGRFGDVKNLQFRS